MKHPADFDLFLIGSDCNDDACITYSAYPHNADERISKYLYAGKYYIVVDTWGHEFGEFDLSLYYDCKPPEPKNEKSCDKSTVITCDSHYTHQTNSHHYGSNYLSSYKYSGTTYSGYSGYEMVYEFKVDYASYYEIELYNHGYGGVDYDMYLYKTDCGKGDAIAISKKYGTHDEYIYTHLHPGTYYIIIDTWYGEVGKFDIKLKGCLTHDPTKDLCDDVHYVQCGTYLKQETTKPYKNYREIYYYGGKNYNGYDGSERVYHFKLAKTEHMKIYLTDITGYGVNYDMFLYRSTCNKNDLISISTGYAKSDEKMHIQLPAGDYYLVVDTWKGEDGYYNLSIDGCHVGGTQSHVDCSEAKYLECGSYYSADTWGKSSKYNYNTYSCTTNGWYYDGGDDIYKVNKSAYGGKIQIHLKTDEKGLNIILAEKCGYEFTCLKEGQDYWGGKYIDQGYFNWGSGEYYIIVDGKHSYTKSKYDLYVTCDPYNFSGAQYITCGADLRDQKTHDGYNYGSIYSCGDNYSYGYVGKEKIYYFDVEYAKQTYIELSSHQYISQMGVMLYKAYNGGYTCWTSGYLSGGSQIIDAYLHPGRYYIVVDAHKDLHFDLKVSGCSCQPDFTLTCGIPKQDDNWNEANDFDGIGDGCFSSYLSLPGKDLSYKFKAPFSGAFKFSLRDMKKDLNLYIVDNCKDGKTCLGFSTKSLGFDDEVTLNLDKDQVVYAVVDAVFESAKSEFTVEVDCEVVIEDSDGDGVADESDNCKDDSNANQADNDNDGRGDACDDDDNDGVADDDDCFALDASRAFSIGDSCDDGDAGTDNDRIDTNCECTGMDDSDGDGVADGDDNCPDDQNSDQQDTDGDGEGDECDIDDDDDGVMDSFDCFPLDMSRSFKIGDICDDGIANTVNDRINDNCACEGVGDGDGISDSIDNCPGMPNADQMDQDNDGFGDVCDNDRDGDGVANANDCDPDNVSVSFQVGDACDDGDAATLNDRIDANCICIGSGQDTDGDGISDADDNCPLIANQDQIDFDGDGLGNSCDQDNDDDGVPNDLDCLPFDATSTFGVGDICDDGNSNTINDMINANCECEGQAASRLYVEDASGKAGDTVCVSVGVAGIQSLGSAMFSLRVDSKDARVISIQNIVFDQGTFNASVDLDGSLGNESIKVSLVSWSTDMMSRFELMDSTTLVDVCIEIFPGGDSCIDVIIDNLISINNVDVDLEFNDADAMPIQLVVSNGKISVEPDSLVNVISGNISTVKGIPLPAANVTALNGSGLVVKTNQFGNYSLGVGSQSAYIIKPYMDERSGNGISMVDVMTLNKHLNFITSFSSEYQYIAADVDGNGEISIRDEQVLVRFIMNMLTEGEMPYSWKFVPVNYELPTIQQYSRVPAILNHPQSAIVQLSNNIPPQNFSGVKIGDLDFSADLTGFLSTEVRSRPIDVRLADKYFEFGETVEAVVSADDFEFAEGVLLHFDIDDQYLNFEGLSTDLPERDYTLINHTVKRGHLALAIFPGKEDYELRFSFTAKSKGVLSDVLSLRKDVLSRIVTEDMEERDISLSFSKAQTSASSMSIAPNPFSNRANIIYDSNKPGQASLSIYNSNGVLLYNKQLFVRKGKNAIILDRNEIGLSRGVFYFVIETEERKLLDKAVILY